MWKRVSVSVGGRNVGLLCIEDAGVWIEAGWKVKWVEWKTRRSKTWPATRATGVHGRAVAAFSLALETCIRLVPFPA